MERKTNKPIMIAGVMFVVTAGIHAFVGGPEVHAPIQASGLDPVVRAVSAVVWHVITALALVIAGALFWVSRRPNPVLVVVFLAINLSFILLFLIVGLTALGSVWPMPQWALFLAISAVMIWGMRAEVK